MFFSCHAMCLPSHDVSMCCDFFLVIFLISSDNPEYKFLDFIYLSQVMQGLCISAQAEHYRRMLSTEGVFTRGTLYWQLVGDIKYWPQSPLRHVRNNEHCTLKKEAEWGRERGLSEGRCVQLLVQSTNWSWSFAFAAQARSIFTAYVPWLLWCTRIVVAMLEHQVCWFPVVMEGYNPVIPPHLHYCFLACRQ